MNQPCTVLISSDGKLSSIDIATLRADLESKDIQKKRNAVKSAIIQMSNGKDMSDLLMRYRAGRKPYRERIPAARTGIPRRSIRAERE